MCVCVYPSVYGGGGDGAGGALAVEVGAGCCGGDLYVEVQECRE